MPPLFKKILLFSLLLVLLVGIRWGWSWYKTLTASSYKSLLKSLYKNTVPRIRVEALEDLETYIILDTRLPNEYAVSHLNKAQLVNYNHPNWAALEQLDKQQKILVYCSVGYRSERIGEMLLEKGFTQVYNLHGGIFEWVNQGKEVVDAMGIPIKAVHGYSPRWGKWVTAPVSISYQ